MNILQRFASETPGEAKKAQVIALFLIAVVAKVAAYHIIPSVVTDDAYCVLIGIATFAQFASKDAAMIENDLGHPLSLLADIPAVLSQISEIHAAIKTPVPAAEPVAQIIAQAEQIIAPTPVVDPVSQPATIIAPPPVVNVPV